MEMRICHDTLLEREQQRGLLGPFLAQQNQKWLFWKLFHCLSSMEKEIEKKWTVWG